jgi:hypothetical protein
MENYDYSIFLSDSSDDYPKYDQENTEECQKPRYSDEKDFKVKEVLRLAKSAIQPWWTEEYKSSTEEIIKEVEDYFEKNLFKAD